MKFKLIFPVLQLFLLLLLTGCNATTAPEDILHIDVYHGDTLVLKAETREDIFQYHQKLYASKIPAGDITGDLFYRLEIRTYDALETYELMFDLSQEKGVALSEKGAFEIPFDWANLYLEALPLVESFSHLNPPEMTLSINGYELPYGINQQWQIKATDSVSYPIDQQRATSENYKSDHLEMVITTEFDRMPPDRLSLKIIGLESTSSFDNVASDALPTPKTPGAYRYELTAHWENPDMAYQGTIIYHFGVSVELPPPPVAYKINGDTFEPGDAIAVVIENPLDLDYRVETKTFTNTIGLFYLDTHLAGIIPLSPWTEPGDYALEFYRDSTGELLETFTYTVVEKVFNIQHLTVTDSTADLKSDENRAKDAEKFKDAKTYSVGEKLWEGTFLQPVDGRISTEYAEYRYVNGSLTSYRHSGIDIAAPTGTPVMADNHGIVTFASDLIISGNVVVIDHGYGLFSSFVHLDEIYVEEGQKVEKGDIIGAVGSTGYSTGPHLHWSLWKNGVWLNPWSFVAKDPLSNFSTY